MKRLFEAEGRPLEVLPLKKMKSTTDGGIISNLIHHNVEQIQHIVNQLIEKNEPITKFTKRYICDELQFDQVFTLLPVTHGNRGAGLEQLEIIGINDLTTSKLFKLLSQCTNLTHFVFDNDERCEYDGIGDSVSKPVLNSLKSIKFLSSMSDKKNDVTVALKILELAPNLEYLEFRYYSYPLDGTALVSISKVCPKLKGIHFETESDLENFGNYIKDDEFFTFFQNEPHLEYIYIIGCTQINGSIYSKMRQFKQLKYFNVDRGCYFEDDHVVDQCDEEPFKGDGVLPHLQYLNIGSEMEGVDVDQLLKMAPNVKNVGESLFNSTSNYLDIVEKLSNRLTIQPILNIDNNTKVLFLQKWLEKTRVLETASPIYFLSKIDLTKLKPISSVKKVELDSFSGLHNIDMKELVRVFPCVEVFYSYCGLRKEVKKTLIELIKERKWPNLRQVNLEVLDEKKSLIKIRPHLTWKFNFRDYVVGSDEPFEKEWLQWDPIIVKSKRSKMERFFAEWTDKQ